MRRCTTCSVTERPNVGLKELLGERSIISRCRERLLGLPKSCRPDAPEWVVMQFAGGDLASVPLGAWARRQPVLLSAGGFDHFDLRFSRPLCRLSKLLGPATLPSDDLAHARSFLHVPVHCLGLFCARLRTSILRQSRWGTRAPRLSRHGCSAPRLALTTPIGPAPKCGPTCGAERERSTTVSPSRLAAQQMRAAHVQRIYATKCEDWRHFAQDAQLWIRGSRRFCGSDDPFAERNLRAR